MMMKSLAAGLISVAALATPAMAQVVVQGPGMTGYSYADTPYAGGYARVAPGPGYYYGHRIQPGPRVGAFATAPWDDGSYGYGYYGYAAPY